MESAGLECIPSSGQSGGIKTKCRAKLAGWSEYVAPYANESKFWYSVWSAAGRPLYGDIFVNMRYSKRQFRYAVRRLKRCQNRLQNDKFLVGLLSGNGNLFKEIREFTK